jgi:hypothetical protein
MVWFEYSRDVFSPSDRAGSAGESRELEFEVARMLMEQGFGRIVPCEEDVDFDVDSDAGSRKDDVDE